MVNVQSYNQTLTGKISSLWTHISSSCRFPSSCCCWATEDERRPFCPGSLMGTSGREISPSACSRKTAPGFDQPGPLQSQAAREGEREYPRRSANTDQFTLIRYFIFHIMWYHHVLIFMFPWSIFYAQWKIVLHCFFIQPIPRFIATVLAVYDANRKSLVRP